MLAKHDAIASGSTLPTQAMDFNPRSAAESSLKPADVNEPSQEPVASPSLQIVPVGKSQIDEDEDEEDDFAQLARRLLLLMCYISCVPQWDQINFISTLVHITPAQQSDDRGIYLAIPSNVLGSRLLP